MTCTFCALQPVRIDGKVQTGVFVAEFTELVEALVENRLIEPVFAPEPPRDVPVWEMDHAEA